MPSHSPRFLYLHGFASGSGSAKGTAFEAHFARRGVQIQRLDLRVPSLEHLRLSAMLEVTRAAIGGPDDRAFIVGSSLGGLTAARLAERDPRISGLLLLAPAFRAMERWRPRLGEPGWQAWKSSGWLAITDYTTRQDARVDFGFAEDVIAIDSVGDGWPDVRVPTLIIHGVHDETIDVDLSRQFARGKPHVRLLEVDDGHELTATLPTILAAADAFLAPWFGAP
jgi:pimeloyl-ACP methyl ester carboxylesterase